MRERRRRGIDRAKGKESEKENKKRRAREGWRQLDADEVPGCLKYTGFAHRVGIRGYILHTIQICNARMHVHMAKLQRASKQAIERAFSFCYCWHRSLPSFRVWLLKHVKEVPGRLVIPLCLLPLQLLHHISVSRSRPRSLGYRPLSLGYRPFSSSGYKKLLIISLIHEDIGLILITFIKIR